MMDPKREAQAVAELRSMKHTPTSYRTCRAVIDSESERTGKKNITEREMSAVLALAYDEGFHGKRIAEIMGLGESSIYKILSTSTPPAQGSTVCPRCGSETKHRNMSVCLMAKDNAIRRLRSSIEKAATRHEVLEREHRRVLRVCQRVAGAMSEIFPENEA